jgi:SAM-dependent methyltransferase
MAVKAIVDEAVRVLLDDPLLPEPLLVLEAGCGSTSDVELPRRKHVVGIDVDPEQLNHNCLLDEKIQGDLQTYELPANRFDLIACVDVLEHLPFPERAIANMSRSLRPGGYLLIAGPEPYSYKGIVAKYTPHSMRHFIFKLITGRPAPELRRIHGNGQIFIPTYLKPICSRRNLAISNKRYGLEVVFERGIDGYSNSELLRPIYKPLLGTVNLFTRLIEAATKGRVNLLHADFVLLLKKSGGRWKQQGTSGVAEESSSSSGIVVQDHEQQLTGQ